MLDHTKLYVEKIHYIDAELAGHVGYVKRQSLCGSNSSLSDVCMLINQQPFAKTTMRYISLPSNLNAIIGVKSYYCVILKMVILHDAIKQFRTGFCDFSKKRAKSCF